MKFWKNVSKKSYICCWEDSNGCPSRRKMVWFILISFSVLYSIYAYISYSTSLDKNSPSYFLFFIILGFFHSVLWYLSVVTNESKEKLFIFILIWDLIYMAIFYLVPVFFFDVKFNITGIIGLFVMIVGLFVMKFGH